MDFLVNFKSLNSLNYISIRESLELLVILVLFMNSINYNGLNIW